ncbi:MAG TPA: histidine kinase dimerization/phospho-acceptor domain-containing protein, partial [Myxococcota bacterium]|nr:histidine kinase dimerization/phospho-acceptor domain-containing protein [Myxococcota bacterium]
MPTAAPDETASAFDRDAHRVLRYGAPCFALLMSIEALSHLITGSSGTDPRVLVPGLSAPIVAAVGLAAWRSEAAGPHPLDAWLLVPWALSLSSIGIHLPAQPVLCLIFASMAALTCAALYLSRRALAVSLPITLIVQIGSAWLSIPELGRGVLLVPVFTLPIALMTHLARRRALLAAEHRRRLELEVQSQKARIERLEQERERLRLEAEMRRQADELDESRRIVRAQGRLASIGSHAAGMVHQISNPVGAILTSADFAILVGDERDGEQIRKESLEHIRAHAERCRRIVRGLLTFSRAHDGERERVDLTVLIERAAAATAHYAKARGARVELSLDGVP